MLTTSTPDEFLNKIAKWKENVMKQNPLNTFRIAELLRPPMFAWFPKDGEPPSRKYVNYLNKIDKINKKLKLFNEDGGVTGMIGFSNKECRSVRCRQHGQHQTARVQGLEGV